MRSDKNVYFLARFTIREGQEDAFHEVAKDVCAAAGSEEGTLNYEWSLSEDGRTCHVLERYVDSDAMRVHFANTAGFIERIFATLDVSGVDVYGSPDAEIRELLTQTGAQFHFEPRFNRPFAGFVR